MKREKRIPDTGLHLDNPRLIASEVSLPMRFFYYFFILLLGISGAYGCFYTPFSISVSWWVVISCAVLFSAAFTVLLLTKRYRILAAILLVFGLGVLLFLRDHLIQGFTHTINAVILAYAQKSNNDFTALPVRPASINEITVFNTVFAVVVLLVITLFMAWLLTRRKNAFSCILLTMPFISTPLLFTIIPHYAAIKSLLIFWAFLLLNAPPLGRTKSFAKKGHVLFKRNGTRMLCAEGNSSEHPASFILLPVLAACLILVGVVFPKQSFQRSDFVEDIRIGLTSGPNISSIFRTRGLGVNTRRVNLQVVGNISFYGKTVLRVKSSTKDGDYLKGFVGSVYTGHSWEALPKEDDQELDAILNEWKVQNFPYLFTQLPYDLIADTEHKYDLTVQNIRGNPRCIYTPYGLVSRPEDLSGIDFVNDGFLRSGNYLFGTKEYSLNAISLTGTISQLLSPVRMSFFVYDTTHIFEGAEEVDGAEGGVFYTYVSGSVGQTDEWTIPDQLLETLTPEQLSFMQSAQEYNHFVYSHYTQLPEELRDSLDQYRQENNLDTDHYQRAYQLARAIISQVQSENAYTLSPGITPAGRDFVEYFLFENHRGYCMHFASATVVLLRSAGIPARYVEGYTVSPDDFQNPDGWADIPDSRAHAWVEIYFSGIGWIPVEATPGAQNGTIDHEAAASVNISVPEAPEENISSEPETAPESPDDPQAEESGKDISSESENPDEITRDESSSERTPNTMLRILAAVTAVGLLPVVLQINRKLRIISRNKSFLQADHNKAVIAIYEHIQKLLPYTKPTRNYSVKIPESLYDLVLKARFSQHMLSELEVRKLLDYAERLADQAREKAPLIRRFVGKNVRALF